MPPMPFAALPATERQAVLQALQRSGVAARHVCVSRMEPATGAGSDSRCVAMVSAPGWYRSYEVTAGWIALLEQDLLNLKAAHPWTHAAQSRQVPPGEDA